MQCLLRLFARIPTLLFSAHEVKVQWVEVTVHLQGDPSTKPVSWLADTEHS